MRILIAAGLIVTSATAVFAAWPGDRQGAYCHQTREYENCGYPTFEACQFTRNGVGGVCVPNPKYIPGPPERRSRYR